MVNERTEAVSGASSKVSSISESLEGETGLCSCVTADSAAVAAGFSTSVDMVAGWNAPVLSFNALPVLPGLSEPSRRGGWACSSR